MARIALIFFLFALFAVCMCAPVNIGEAAVRIFSDSDYKAKAKAAASVGLAAVQKLSSTLNEQIQKSGTN